MMKSLQHIETAWMNLLHQFSLPVGSNEPGFKNKKFKVTSGVSTSNVMTCSLTAQGSSVHFQTHYKIHFNVASL